MTAANLKITQIERVPLVKDFGTFTDYLKERTPSLVRKGQLLTKKTLYEIDQLLTSPDLENTPQTDKIFYPHLTLFYYLVLRGGLFVKNRKLQLQETEKLAKYCQLNPTEKYFFLLETFWVDSDWRELLGKYSTLSLIPEIESIIRNLARTPPGKVLPMEKSKRTWRNSLKMYSLLHYLSLFGLLQISFDNQGYTFEERTLFFIASVTVTDFGGAFFPILSNERTLRRWNLPHIREKTGKFAISPRLGKHRKGKGHESFVKPFQRLFNDLRNTLPRNHFSGTFTFKVFLERNCWRTIVLSSEHTLEDLHDAIQDAFEFDSDHLYAFFTDGIPWSYNRILSPYDTEGPFSDKVSIGELGLLPGQRVLYIFDFGSEWHFKLEVLEKKDVPGPLSPVIRERKGKSPEQYPEWE